MKNTFTKTKTAIILLIVTVLFLGFYTYMIARPISYGMGYHNEMVYDGVEFEGTLKFYPNGKVTNENSNFEEVLEDYYYYKDGYVFILMAQTDEEYEAEVADIKENFDELISAPLYASKINAFTMAFNGLDNDVTTYTCNGAINFVIAGSVVALVLVALTVSSFVLSKKTKAEE